MARILVLRERGEAERTAALLAARGHEPLLLPLHEIRPLGPEVPDGAWGGVLITSGYAVDWLARLFDLRNVPVLAVGEATAARLRKAGFGDVRVGSGEADGLLEPAGRIFAETGLPLLYIAGRVRRPTLENGLRDQRAAFHTIEVYDTIGLQPDAADIAASIGPVPPDAVLLLSQGQAETYQALAERFEALLPPRLCHLCLSKRIADSLSGERHQSTLTTSTANLDALLNAFENGDAVNRCSGRNRR